MVSSCHPLRSALALLCGVGGLLLLLFSDTGPVKAQTAGPFTCTAVTDIPPSECQALVALYNQTNGAGWTSNSGWLVSSTPCSWSGITCTDSHIMALMLPQNQLSGTVPSQLGNLPYLQALSLEYNQLSGSIPSQLGTLTNLQELHLDRNQFSGAIPAELGALVNLQALGLDHNHLSGAIPAQLGALLTLQKLWLHDNELSGALPPELGNLTALQELWLNNNQLSGTIPLELANLQNLQYLLLHTNQLSGTIPPELGNLKNLQYLYLHTNQLSGTIPAQLGKLTALKDLLLNDNQLSGAIPLELGNLITLKALWLNNNQLSGTLPLHLGNLRNLQEFGLNHNPALTGSLPSTFTQLAQLRQFYFTATALCVPPERAFQDWLQTIPDLVATNPLCPAPTLVLVYAVLDNNLGRDDGGGNWNRLVNNLETGVHDGVKVRLLIDGYGADNSYVYDLIHDENPFCPSTTDMSCDGRYVDGGRRTAWSEDTAQPQRLYEFVKQGFRDYPADKTILVLIGHGSGWSANGLPGQPTGWGEQTEQVGGMLWDDTPGGLSDGARSLSTKALGAALTWATAATAQKLDLLYLDACSMGMAEVAYELRDSADYLLASPNTKWAAFAYNDLLPLVNADQDGRSLGQAWLDSEARVLHAGRYPFTLALLDLAQMGQLSTTVSILADTLDAALQTQLPLITTAHAQSERYESIYDGAIITDDSYIDLATFAQQLAVNFGQASPIGEAAIAVKAAITQVVAAKAVESGSPWTHPGQIWRWTNAGGLAIYLPAQTKTEAAKRLLYNANHLAWAKDSRWDEFLENYWKAQPEPTGVADSALPTCSSTTACKTVLANLLPLRSVFLPLIRR